MLPTGKPGISQCMNIFDADMYVYIRCFCYILYVMIWIAMYGLSCISLVNSYTREISGKVFLYVDLYQRKYILNNTTQIDYLYFIFMPHNEFHAGRDSFHAPSAILISPYMHATQ